MKTLCQYILENSNETRSNKERKAKLEQWLKSKNYPDYIKTLNKMLDDPKAASLLQDGFGGDLGNMKLTYSVKEIAAKKLIPTQSEIDISKSLKHGITKVDKLLKDFNEPIVINNMPLITFNSKYIIDGHHRWAETAIINPDGKMMCFNYDGDIKPIEMLKAVQGTIAAVMADDNGNNEKLPTGKVEDKNIYDMTVEEISEYINTTITQLVCNQLEKFVGTTSQEDSIDFIIKNVQRFQKENKPPKGMPNRGEMPQTDKAGIERGNKETSFPDKNGSALNKLKQGKIDKDAIQ